MTGADNGNRSQAQGDAREGGAEGSVSANRRPHEQERTVRQDTGDECAREHEIQQLSEACSVESGGTAGKFSVLPREVSGHATAGAEKSAEVVVGSAGREARGAEGPKNQGDDLTQEVAIGRKAREGGRAAGAGSGKQRWLPGFWLPNAGSGQAVRTPSQSEREGTEERQEEAPIGLMEKIVSDENAEAALRAVERNQGAAGVDGMETEQLRAHLEKHWSTIKGKLLKGSYRPSPVKRVWLEKPDGGKRPLGIPTVLDRFIQQLMLGELQLLFEPNFSESSWGFRAGRGAHDAVRASRRFLTEEGKSWVVDMDIKGFFDAVDHDLLVSLVAKEVEDKRVLGLIGRYLRSGVLEAGQVSDPPDKGTPQGGPLSPILANIYLDVLDKELERRGLRFSRYADDCNIYVGSEAAARRVLASVTRFVEKRLKLEVSASKSGIGRPWERKFLGFVINRAGRIEVAPKAMERFRARVREHWEGRQSSTSEGLRDRWRRFIRGWYGYYRLAEERRQLLDQDRWIRRHIRKCFWHRWHGYQGRRRHLAALGVGGALLRAAHSSQGTWAMARHKAMQVALNNARLRRHGFLCFADLLG